MVQAGTSNKGQSAIAAVLRYGSVFSAVVMGFGVLLAFVSGRKAPTTSHVSPAQLMIKVLQLDPMGIAELGIFLLLLTPVLRVAVAAVGFGIERDRKYVLISLGVLSVLLASIAFSLR